MIIKYGGAAMIEEHDLHDASVEEEEATAGSSQGHGPGDDGDAPADCRRAFRSLHRFLIPSCCQHGSIWTP